MKPAVTWADPFMRGARLHREIGELLDARKFDLARATLDAHLESLMILAEAIDATEAQLIRLTTEQARCRATSTGD